MRCTPCVAMSQYNCVAVKRRRSLLNASVGNFFQVIIFQFICFICVYAAGCLGIYRVEEGTARYSNRLNNECCITLHNFIAVCIRRFPDVLGKKVLVSHCKIYKGKKVIVSLRLFAKFEFSTADKTGPAIDDKLANITSDLINDTLPKTKLN